MGAGPRPLTQAGWGPGRPQRGWWEGGPSDRMVCSHGCGIWSRYGASRGCIACRDHGGRHSAASLSNAGSRGTDSLGMVSASRDFPTPRRCAVLYSCGGVARQRHVPVWAGLPFLLGGGAPGRRRLSWSHAASTKRRRSLSPCCSSREPASRNISEMPVSHALAPHVILAWAYPHRRPGLHHPLRLAAQQCLSVRGIAGSGTVSAREGNSKKLG